VGGEKVSGVVAVLPDREGRSGRFQAATAVVSLFDQIALVARFATGGDEQKAAKLSKGQWDAARISLGLQLPLAESIRQRQGLSWSELLHCSLLPAQKRALYLRNRRDPNWGSTFGALCEEYLLDLLRSVAFRLPPGTPLTELRFDDEIRRMEQESRHWKVAEPLRLPRSVQLIAKFGKWNHGLKAAGIPPILPIPSAKVKLADAVSALELAFAKLGKLPTAAYFRKWCRLQHISLPTRFQYTPEVLAELTTRRANQGLLTSLEPINACHLPKLAAPIGHRQTRWTRDQAMGALRTYAALYKDPKAIPTQKDYCLKSSGNPVLPSIGVIQRFGGFTDLCKEAGIL
jgi:hypothetical protein